MGISFWVVLPIAAVVCFIVGLMLGFPALRVQHHYLAFATLGFNVLVYLVMRNEEKLTGGTFGIANIPRPSLFGYSLDGALPFFYFTYVSVILLATVLWFLLRSPWAAPLQRCATIQFVRKAPASTSPRIRCWRLRSCRLRRHRRRVPDRAGQLHRTGTVQSLGVLDDAWRSSSAARAASGPVLGSVIVILLPEWLRFLKDWYLALFGFAVIVMMIFLPGGLLSLADRFKARGGAK
jgi:branched-chain amino acid transport system permease protein